MGHEHDIPSEDLDPGLPGARTTFIAAMIGAVLFIGVVVLVIL